MKKIIVILLCLISFSFIASASVEEDISAELGLENAIELIPERLDDMELSPSNTPSQNGMNIKAIFNTLINHIFDALGNEVVFFCEIVVVLVIYSVINSMLDASRSAVVVAVRFCVSALVASLIINHIENALYRAEIYVDELSSFMTGLLPFIGSLSLAGGEVSTSVVQKALLLFFIDFLQSFLASIVLPISKAIVSLSLVGYVSGVAFGSISTFISSVATKTITISCGIMCAVLYFQNAVSTVTDSLALRSVKLAAGSFIPIVGSFVSEASGTLITGVRLVKSTFGVFAICVLVYMSVQPIINFLIIKLSLRLSGAVSELLGCSREGKLMGEISSVYNIVSALMICSACFFIFSVAVFIKSEVK